MVRHGVELYNPCQLVHVWHNHASDLRKNQNSTQLGQSIWGGTGVFPCPPQLMLGGEDGSSVKFGRCSGRPGWGRTILLEEGIAFDMVMRKYRSGDDGYADDEL